MSGIRTGIPRAAHRIPIVIQVDGGNTDTAMWPSTMGTRTGPTKVEKTHVIATRTIRSDTAGIVRLIVDTTRVMVRKKPTRMSTVRAFGLGTTKDIEMPGRMGPAAAADFRGRSDGTRMHQNATTPAAVVAFCQLH